MFKLLEIEFIDHPFFKSLLVKFVSDNEKDALNYTTLIIGPNGTGKSKILSAAIGIFNSLESAIKKKQGRYRFDFSYRLRFTNKGHEHYVEYLKNELVIDGNDFSAGDTSLNLPSKVLVSAFSFNDKYPLREQRGKVINENYYYLGLKSTTNNIFLGNPTKNAITNLYDAVIGEKDITPLKEAFTTLELRPQLTLIYKPGKYFKFLQNINLQENVNFSPNQFENSFTEYYKKRKRKDSNPELKRLGNEKIEELLSNSTKIKSVIEYLRENIQSILDLRNKEILFKPILDLDERNSYSDFVKHVLPFQLLSDLQIISFQRFEIKKLHTNFSFDDASSGEYHIILTYLNILCRIEENSLVLIDEPEISLHPNWQIKYMNIFTKIFRPFAKTHFIVASHSHFLVSDLKSESSNILAIDVNIKGEISLTTIEKSTYGWSAEQILLDIFKVATTRNYYLTLIVGKILDEMSHIDFDKEKIKSEIRELKKYHIDNLNDNDPMKLVIQKLLAKVDI